MIIILLVVVFTAPVYAMLNFIFDRVLKAPTIRQVDHENSVLVMMKRFVVGMGQDIRNSIATLGRRGGINMAMRQNDVSGDSVSGRGSFAGSMSSAPGSMAIFGSLMQQGRRSLSGSSEEGKDGSTMASDMSMMPTAHFLMGTKSAPREFKISLRVGVEAALEKLKIDLNTQIAFARHLHIQHRMENDAERRLYRARMNEDLSEGGLREQVARRMSFMGGKVSASSSSDLIAFDLTKSYVPENLTNLFMLMMKELETEMAMYRRTLTLQQKEDFDCQWGIWGQTGSSRFNRAGYKARPADFAPKKVAHALIMAQKKADGIAVMPDHHAGAELISLFCSDMLGDNPAGRTFEEKFKSEFRSTLVLTFEFKVAVAVFIGFLNLFFVYGSMQYAVQNTKGNADESWQKTWLIACVLKAVFDIFVKRLAQSVVIQYVVPNIILEEVRTIKFYLRKAARRLAHRNANFRLNKFSATDYTFSSAILAKNLPHLVESKIILMYRDVVPERVQQAVNRKRTGVTTTFLQTMTLTLSTLMLHFGTLPEPVKKVFVHFIPSFFFTMAIWLLSLVDDKPVLFSLVVSALVLLIGLPLCYYFYRTLGDRGVKHSEKGSTGSANDNGSGNGRGALNVGRAGLTRLKSRMGLVDVERGDDGWMDESDDDEFCPPEGWEDDAEKILKHGIVSQPPPSAPNLVQENDLTPVTNLERAQSNVPVAVAAQPEDERKVDDVRSPDEVRGFVSQTRGWKDDSEDDDDDHDDTDVHRHEDDGKEMEMHAVPSPAAPEPRNASGPLASVSDELLTPSATDTPAPSAPVPAQEGEDTFNKPKATKKASVKGMKGKKGKKGNKREKLGKRGKAKTGKAKKAAAKAAAEAEALASSTGVDDDYMFGLTAPSGDESDSGAFKTGGRKGKKGKKALSPASRAAAFSGHVSESEDESEYSFAGQVRAVRRRTSVKGAR